MSVTVPEAERGPFGGRGGDLECERVSERGDRDRNLDEDGDLELDLIMSGAGAGAGERGERPRIIDAAAAEGF